MIALGEEVLHKTASRSLLLDRWPEQTIGFMGQAILNVTDLRYRNGQVENICPDNTTEVFFSTVQPSLEIGGLSKRFSSSVAKLLGCLVEKDPGICSNSELRDDIARIYDIAIKTAGGVMTEGVQALKYWTFDSKGALIYTQRGYTGLRDDLLFLPQIDTNTVLIPAPTETSHKDTSEETRPIFVAEPDLKIGEVIQTRQQYAAWWPDYTPRHPGDLPRTAGEYTERQELDGQQTFVYRDEEPNGQRILDIYYEEKPELLVSTEDSAVPTGSQAFEQLEFEYDSSSLQDDSVTPETKENESAIRIFRTADVFEQAAMTAAFDYFFKGGELPVVTDITTFIAFQKAIQETGGYESTEISGPVIKLYFGTDKIRMKGDISRRIKALGESIHGERPKEVNTRTITPSENLSNAPKGWMKAGACRGLDPDIFQPDKDADDNSPEVQAAKNVCQSCSVRVDCLNYALTTKQMDGVWGGATERERRVLRRRRARGIIN